MRLPELFKAKIGKTLAPLLQVRALGAQLGLPEDILYRHPFPGPGLAIRILGAVCQADCDLLREADDIFLQVRGGGGGVY